MWNQKTLFNQVLETPKTQAETKEEESPCNDCEVILNCGKHGNKEPCLVFREWLIESGKGEN